VAALIALVLPAEAARLARLCSSALQLLAPTADSASATGCVIVAAAVLACTGDDSLAEHGVFKGGSRYQTRRILIALKPGANQACVWVAVALDLAWCRNGDGQKVSAEAGKEPLLSAPARGG
jgi:hypothetical protein